jgi:hypothetical protein
MSLGHEQHALELAAARTPAGSDVTVDVALADAPAVGDHLLPERLAANVVDNAVAHNVPGGWVRVTTGTRLAAAFLEVVNSGPPSPPGTSAPCSNRSAASTDATARRRDSGSGCRSSAPSRPHKARSWTRGHGPQAVCTSPSKSPALLDKARVIVLWAQRPKEAAQVVDER